MQKLRIFAALNRLLRRVSLILATGVVFLFLSTASAHATDEDPGVTTIVTPGGDDVSYQVPLTTSVIFDGVTYENVYATTNSVITFGNPDGTYWDYPMTPSVSLQSRDWWALPVQMPDTHFIISVSDGGFQVDGAYRPFGTYTGDVTTITITASILTSGNVTYTYTVDGPLYGGERLGARLNDGTVVPLEEIGIVETETPVDLNDTPVDNVDTGGGSTDSGGGSTGPELPPSPPDEPDNPSDSGGSGSGGSESPGDSGSGSSSGETGNQGGGPVDVPSYDIPVDIPNDSGNPQDTPESSDNQQTDSSTDSNTTEEQTPTEEESQSTSNEQNSESDDSADEPQTEEPTEQTSDNQEQQNQSEESSSEPTTTEEAVAAILAAAGDSPVTAEALAEAGLTYSDLPPDTPVDVRTDENGNAVIITAEVAAALELLDSPAALLNGVMNCLLPSDVNEQLTEEQKCQVLAALANIGADMSPQEREEATKMVVATVIAAGAAMNAVAAATPKAPTGGGTPSGGSGGPSDNKAVRRRRRL